MSDRTTPHHPEFTQGSGPHHYSTPKISVITVAFNAGNTIERTITSVQAQTYPNMEHIVIDGGSTDDTISMLDRYRPHFAHCVSEPDRGIADAMNKGATAATGDYYVFLNADDSFADPSALEAALQAIATAPGYDFYAFCIFFGSPDNYERRCSRSLDWRMRFKTGIFHQGVLCNASAHHKLGGFRTTLSYALDYDYFLRAYLAGMSLRPINQTLAFMSVGGMSTGRDWPSVRRRLDQEQQIHKITGQGAWKLIYTAYWALYHPFKYVKHSADPRGS